jgi:hypothetical protein
MGIDWVRMRPKRNAPQGRLNELIDLQAKAFQGLPSLWSTNQIEPLVHDEQEDRRLRQQYGESSRALGELLGCVRIGPLYLLGMYSPLWISETAWSQRHGPDDDVPAPLHPSFWAQGPHPGGSARRPTA